MNTNLKYCRICLEKNFIGQSIFEHYKSQSLTEIVMTISGIEILKLDKFSHLICFNCASLLVNAIEIREKCLNTNQILHQYEFNEHQQQQSLQQALEIFTNKQQSNNKFVENEERHENSNINDVFDKTVAEEELWRKIVEESSELNEQFSAISTNHSVMELEKEFDDFIANLISSDTTVDDNFCNSSQNFTNSSVSDTEWLTNTNTNTNNDCNLNNSDVNNQNVNLNNNYLNNNYDGKQEKCNLITNMVSSSPSITTKMKIQLNEYENCMKLIRTAYERHQNCYQHHSNQHHQFQFCKQERQLQFKQQQQQPQNNKQKHFQFKNQTQNFNCLICRKFFLNYCKFLVCKFLVNKQQENSSSKCNKKNFETKDNTNLINCSNKNSLISTSGQNYEFAASNNDNGGDITSNDSNNEYVLECKLCKNHKTISLTLYLQHMREKHQIDDVKPFKCRICCLSFASKQGMYRHIDNIHENNRKNLRNREKKFLCNTCGKFFYTNFHLEIHIRTHTGEKPFKCKDCDKSFAQMSGLRMHNLTHTGEKPFCCKICGKSFSQYGHVKEHYLIHSNEKNHICSICGHSFRVKGNLTAHMLIHSGKKPFSCGHCGKEFIQRTKLRAHVNKYHQPEYSEEDDDNNSGTVNGDIVNRDIIEADLEAATDKIIEQQNMQLKIFNELDKNTHTNEQQRLHQERRYQQLQILEFKNY